jgi:transposase
MRRSPFFRSKTTFSDRATRARRTAIELAWLWLRHQPESDLARWFQERVGAGKGRIRRTMIVALARKLMVALWRYVTQGLVPEGAVIKG